MPACMHRWVLRSCAREMSPPGAPTFKGRCNWIRINPRFANTFEGDANEVGERDTRSVVSDDQRRKRFPRRRMAAVRTGAARRLAAFQARHGVAGGRKIRR